MFNEFIRSTFVWTLEPLEDVINWFWNEDLDIVVEINFPTLPVGTMVGDEDVFIEDVIDNGIGIEDLIKLVMDGLIGSFSECILIDSWVRFCIIWFDIM